MFASTKSFQICHQHMARHALPVTGDMDLDPDTGSYRLSANVPRVDANDLRKTLGVRPPPYPVAGALRGVLHCTGPLEKPVFSGKSQPTNDLEAQCS